MPERYERFRIEPGPKGPQVVLDQRRNAVGNVIIGVSIVLGGYFAAPEVGGVLIGIGLAWGALAFLALFSSRVLILGDPLEYTTGKKTRLLPHGELESFRVYRKASHYHNRRRPLPWTVEIRAVGEEKPFIEFRFAAEKPARLLAERMGEVTGIALERQR